MLRLALAALHLLALGIGLGAIWGRARALGDLVNASGGGASDASAATPHALRRAFSTDSWWGVAAALWIATGLWRTLAGTEKGTAYYLGNHVFWAKMGLLLAIIALEVWPATTLVRWRMAAKGSAGWSAEAARRIVVISYVQLALVVAMVIAAAAMARGYGAR